MLAYQLSFTFMSVYYASLRRKGISLFPLAVKTAPKWAAVGLWGYLGYKFGKTWVKVVLGDKNARRYLHTNKAAILDGTISMN